MIAFKSIKDGKNLGTFGNVSDKFPRGWLRIDRTFGILVETAEINTKANV